MLDIFDVVSGSDFTGLQEEMDREQQEMEEGNSSGK